MDLLDNAVVNLKFILLRKYKKEKRIGENRKQEWEDDREQRQKEKREQASGRTEDNRERESWWEEFRARNLFSYFENYSADIKAGSWN